MTRKEADTKVKEQLDELIRRKSILGYSCLPGGPVANIIIPEIGFRGAW